MLHLTNNGCNSIFIVYTVVEGMVRARIQKWGNSLALRIPKYIAEEAGLYKDRTVDLTLFEGKMLITPETITIPTLEQLLAGVTPENQHGEIDSSKATGNEAW